MHTNYENVKTVLTPYTIIRWTVKETKERKSEIFDVTEYEAARELIERLYLSDTEYETETLYSSNLH